MEGPSGAGRFLQQQLLQLGPVRQRALPPECRPRRALTVSAPLAQNITPPLCAQIASQRGPVMATISMWGPEPARVKVFPFFSRSTLPLSGSREGRG